MKQLFHAGKAFIGYDRELGGGGTAGGSKYYEGGKQPMGER